MKTQLLLLLVLSVLTGSAQSVLMPGSDFLDKKYIKDGKYEMATIIKKDGQNVEISAFIVTIKSDNKTLSVYTAMKMVNADDVWRDTSIADITTFKPIYRSSFTPQKEMVMRYGPDVSGYYYDKKTQKKIVIKERMGLSFFDSHTYPYLLGILPLELGFKSDLSVYEFKPNSSSNIKKARITEVKSSLYTSKLTGDHKCWQVDVIDEGTKEYYKYHIDKANRRLWKLEIVTQGQLLSVVDQETDFNPFKTTFDKEQTLKMITEGKSSILGLAFAKENQSPIKGIAILNVNKRQYAQQGTKVVLIPYTPYFKEWLELDEAARKKGRTIPLAKEVAECMKVARVYDNDGHFEFTGLLPGEYMLYTEFNYLQSASWTETVGYTDTYINGGYVGSTANTETHYYKAQVTAAIKKIIAIKKNGESLEAKLKKTL